MNEKIINKMSHIVANTMKSFQSDFENWDKPYVATADESKFPMLWIVAKTHTYLLKLGGYEEIFNNDEAARYAYAQGGDPYTVYLSWLGGDKIYLITQEDVKETTEKAAHSVIRDMVTPVVVRWKAKNGPLPKNFKLPIRFNNLSLSKLKEMFRTEEGREGNTLIKTLHNFRNYRRTALDHYLQLSYNPGWKEFTFCEYRNGKQGLVGGVIFHGWPETGYQENYAVQLTPSYGWSIHT